MALLMRKWNVHFAAYGRSMTTLPNRPHTALTVIDVQTGVVADAHDRDRVVGNIAALVDRARDHGTPVVWVLHSHPQYLPRESEPWQLVPELAIVDGERVVHKTYADSFEETDLEEVLADLGVGRLVVSGAQTDECIRSTLHGALVRGYDAVLVSDAHTTEDQSEYGAPTPDLVITHTNLYWTHHRAPGREAGTVTTADATF
jgi:nicotinamidase-related amidase